MTTIGSTYIIYGDRDHDTETGPSLLSLLFTLFGVCASFDRPFGLYGERSSKYHFHLRKRVIPQYEL